MSKISCEIIKDLLPLYYDEICSNDSMKIIEEHIIVCDSCKNELEKIKLIVDIPKEIIDKQYNESSTLKGIAMLWNSSKAKSFLKGLTIASLISIIIICGYIGLFKLNITSVSTDVIELSDVSQLKDGRIAYNIRFKDDYEVNRIKFNMDDKGNFYLTPSRPIIKSKSIMPKGFSQYDTINDLHTNVYKAKYGELAEIKAFYVGSSDNNILIWKEGMELPSASKELEAIFSNMQR